MGDMRGDVPSQIAVVGREPVMRDDCGGSLGELARGRLPAAEQAALAQLAAGGIVPQPANESRWLNYDCLSMENYEGIRLRQYRMTLEEQRGATTRHLMRCGNDCWRAAGRRSVNPVLTTGLRKRQTAWCY